MRQQQSARVVSACIAALGLLLLSSAAPATAAAPQEGRQQPAAAFNFRRALRPVIDEAVTEHWSHGQATVTSTWVPAKAAHDKKEAAKAPPKDTPKKIKETIYLKPVDDCDSDECIKQYIPDFHKKSKDDASAPKTFSINKEAVLKGTVSGTTHALEVATKSGP